jgi:hypothetical protein
MEQPPLLAEYWILLLAEYWVHLLAEYWVPLLAEYWVVLLSIGFLRRKNGLGKGKFEIRREWRVGAFNSRGNGLYWGVIRRSRGGYF